MVSSVGIRILGLVNKCIIDLRNKEVRMQFRNTWLSGMPVDVHVSGGKVTSIVAHDPSSRPGDIEGGMLCSHFAEPHVHLDATQLGAQMPNRSGTLFEGIDNWAILRAGLTPEDVRKRALKTIRWYVNHGVTRIRTHVDTASPLAAEALLTLRSDLKGSDLVGIPVQLQVVAFPQEGILNSAQSQSDWERVVAMGCDAVGCIPHYEASHEAGNKTVRMCFDLAEQYGAMVDLHCDETDNPDWRALLEVCKQTKQRGFGGLVVAGHCTAMHSWPDDLAERAIAAVVEAEVQVVTNPLDNIVLGGRGDRYPKRRGLTRVDELWAAGARVGIGHDSVVDPWYRLGTANMLDPAYMLVHAGHLTGEAEMVRVFETLHRENHLPFGAPPELTVGSDANLLWFEASNPIDALRTRHRPRVFHQGTEFKETKI
jgi:cytosine deaminase